MIEKYRRTRTDHRAGIVIHLDNHFGRDWKKDNEILLRARNASRLLEGEDFFDPQDKEVHDRFLRRFVGAMDDNKPVWMRKDKTTIPIEDMDDGHLDNAIKMLERAGRSPNGSVLSQLLKERSKRFCKSSGKPIDSLAVFEELGS